MNCWRHHGTPNKILMLLRKLHLLSCDLVILIVFAFRNAYHTLFVGRLSYDITDKKLKREMEQYGPVKAVKLVTDKDGKSRGYAFVEFEKEEDMTNAFKRADGKKLEGRRIVVDVERGRYLFSVS